MHTGLKAAGLILLGMGWSACDTPAPRPDQTNSNACTFVFSKSVPPADPANTANWCRKTFADAVLINADRSNPNRRYFLPGQDLVRVAVRAGNLACSFMARKKGEKTLEIFTSDNFPACLSNRIHYQWQAGQDVFSFNNQQGIRFSAAVRPGDSGPALFLEFPPDASYGLLVHRCADCQ
jgi:hypothetical protein